MSMEEWEQSGNEFLKEIEGAEYSGAALTLGKGYGSRFRLQKTETSLTWTFTVPETHQTFSHGVKRLSTTNTSDSATFKAFPKHAFDRSFSLQSFFAQFRKCLANPK